jgi:hypothetical protein
MRKLSLLTTILAVAILPACVKELKPSDPGADNTATSKGKPSPPPPPPSLLQWQKTYGSPLNELGYAIAKAKDGSGYVFTASVLGKSGDIANYHGGIGADVWVVKIDNAGTIAWQQSLGGTASEYANHIIATADGNSYVFAGETKSNDGDVTGNHGGYDLWVVKLDAASGSIVWQKTYGGSADESPGSANATSNNSIIETIDGGFLITGSTRSTDGDLTGQTAHGGDDAWVVKLTSNGDMAWQKTYGGSLNETANSIIPASGGGYLVSATSNSIDGDLSAQIHHGGSDCWIFKLNDNGDLLWQKTYGGSGNEGAESILPAPDGNYIFSASTTSNNGDVSGNHGGSDAWVVKIGGDGTKLLQKCFGGSDIDNALLKDIDALGRILLVGYTFNKNNGDISGGDRGTEDMWALQVDASLNKLNSTALGGNSDDTGTDVVATGDGMYMSIGRAASTNGDVTFNHGGEDVWLVKFKF